MEKLFIKKMFSTFRAVPQSGAARGSINRSRFVLRFNALANAFASLVPNSERSSRPQKRSGNGNGACPWRIQNAEESSDSP